MAVNDVARALVALAELGALEHAAPELELAQMALDRPRVVVGQLLRSIAKKRLNPSEPKLSGLLLGDLPQPLQTSTYSFSSRTEPVEDDARARAGPQRQPTSRSFGQRLDRERVELPDDRRVLEAVGEHALAVDDRVGVAQAGQHHALGRLEQELVSGGHRAP